MAIVFPVKVPYTVSADISKYQCETFNVHPELFYLDQTKKETIMANINSMTEDTLTYKNLHHIKRIIDQ